MKEKYKELWQVAEKELAKAVRKDFVIHTKGVVKAMELILEKENGNEDVLYPSAILHDIGWVNVPHDLQRSKEKEGKQKALELHITEGVKLARKVLERLEYKEEEIQEIVDVIESHKLKDPRDAEKRLLIDADTLSDIFREQFYSDVKEYESTPEDSLEFRSQNTFFTDTARGIFEKEFNERKKEIENNFA